jgi:hypothetical protein
MVLVKVVLLPKSCCFNSWTSINLYGWKFKSWCKIRQTIVSDNLRACGWRTADQRGLCSTAYRTALRFPEFWPFVQTHLVSSSLQKPWYGSCAPKEVSCFMTESSRDAQH